LLNLDFASVKGCHDLIWHTLAAQNTARKKTPHREAKKSRARELASPLTQA
jgi:hypothetical protein